MLPLLSSFVLLRYVAGMEENVGHGCTWVVGRLYFLAAISYPLVDGLSTPDELAIPFPKINKRQPHP